MRARIKARLTVAVGLAAIIPEAVRLARRGIMKLAQRRPKTALLLEGALLVGGGNAYAFFKQDFPRFWPIGAALTLACLAWVAWMGRNVHGYGPTNLGLARGQVGRGVWAAIGAFFLLGLAVGLFDAAMYAGSALGDGAGGALWQHWGARSSFALAGGAHLVGAALLALGSRIAHIATEEISR